MENLEEIIFSPQEENNIYNERQYVIFSITELDQIDFNQVLETSAATVRKSVDGSKTFVKWEKEVPSSVASLLTKTQYYNHQEILQILETAEWTYPAEIV